jgi:hypothetical protein
MTLLLREWSTVQRGEIGLRQELRPWVCDLRPLETGVRPLPDSTRKYLAFDHLRRPFAVAILSPPLDSSVVANNLRNLQQAAEALGSLAHVILEPLQSGWVDGQSYAIFPLCGTLNPSRLARAIQLTQLRDAVLHWLQEATQLTLANPTDSDIAGYFASPLEYLSAMPGMPAPIQKSAIRALRRLDAGSWVPRFCLMHGDLWTGNTLLAPGSESWRQFVLIDWGDLMVRGFGIYDLIRFALCTRLDGAPLRRSVEAHCRVLGCGYEDARSYLAAYFAYYAMKHYGENRGYFPIENFIRCSLECANRLESCSGNSL